MILLGGNPPDTIPAISFNQGDLVPGSYAYSGFSLLPDVNGDGYDDLGVNVSNWAGDADLYYIYFGSEHLDLNLDLMLKGESQFYGNADISGCDLNGDGYGDIITGNGGGNDLAGEVHIYFGRPGLASPPQILSPDININGQRDYNCTQLGTNVGAVGDYNGDGIDDIIVGSNPGSAHAILLILAGNSDWETGVPSRNCAPTYSLNLKGYPNPSNNSVSLSFYLPTGKSVDLTIREITGRSIVSVVKGVHTAGNHVYMWDSSDFPTGVYLGVLTLSGTDHAIDYVKLVHLK